MMALLGPWWRDRTPREQLLLTIALVLMTATIAWLAVLRPLEAARSRAEARVTAASLALAETGRLTQEIRSAERRAAATGPAMEQVTKRLAEAGITADLVEPQPGGAVRVRVPAVRASVLLGWVARLERSDGLVVDSLTITRNPDPNVAATLLVRRPQ